MFRHGEFPTQQKQQVSKLSVKLDAFANLLGLNPYNENTKFKKKILPISYDAIQAVLTICPSSAVCVDQKCEPWGLLQSSAPRDIPLVTLIKDDAIYKDVPVLMGKCSTCNTSYYADHERFQSEGSWNRCYLNSAQFLKIGLGVWVDRKFSHSVLSGMYNFHASASTYTQCWNDCNSITNSTFQVTRRLIWQTFVQESIRSIASTKNTNLELPESLNIKEIAEQAFLRLGDAGKLEVAKNHSCSQCTQPYKATADFMGNDDPAVVVGADENNTIPALVGENAALSAQESAEERRAARERANNLNAVANMNDDTMDVDYKDVTMRVIDGVVMSPAVGCCSLADRKILILL